MKHLKALLTFSTLVAVAAFGLTASVSVANACDGHAKQTSAKQVSATSTMCGGKTVSAGCAATCASGAKSASLGCAGKKGEMASAEACKWGRVGECCTRVGVMYRVSSNGEATDFVDRAEAFKASETAGAPVQFVALGTPYETEDAAARAMVAALEGRIQKLMTVELVGGSEASHCAAMKQNVKAGRASKAGYKVASREFDREGAANAYLAHLREAVEKLQKSIENDAESKSVRFKVGDRVTDSEAKADLYVAQERLYTILSGVSES
jgi:hypothetical protein